MKKNAIVCGAGGFIGGHLVNRLKSEGYLFFAVPIGQGLIPPMMEFTADFTVFLVQLSGIPIYRDGLFFSLPSGNWSVVEECSGVRYLIASLALSTIYANFIYQTLRKRIIFIIVAALVPIIANSLRAYGIVMIGHLGGMELATGTDHLIYGWIFFAFIMFVMFFLGNYWSDPPIEFDNSYESSIPLFLPDQKKKLYLATLTSLILIIGFNSLANQTLEQSTKTIEDGSLSLPMKYDTWQKQANVNIGWSPIFHSPDSSVEGIYKFSSATVQLNIGYYHFQRQGAEAVSTLNRLVNPFSETWKLTRRDQIQMYDRTITESEIRWSNEKILIWHWYQLGDKQTSNPYIAKVLEAYNIVVYGRHDASMITVAKRMENLVDDRSHLQNFIEVSSHDIRSRLGGLSE